jgi:hypothetical protein
VGSSANLGFGREEARAFQGTLPGIQAFGSFPDINTFSSAANDH